MVEIEFAWYWSAIGLILFGVGAYGLYRLARGGAVTTAAILVFAGWILGAVALGMSVSQNIWFSMIFGMVFGSVLAVANWITVRRTLAQMQSDRG